MFPLILLLSLSAVSGDIYLHNPRGSNNRVRENTRNVRNPKNSFDSQNNNRGGYNTGPSYYFQGSTLAIEWTNQHSCHAENNNCELILQYMCEPNMRDGIRINIIPFDKNKCANNDCTTDREYRMHEDYMHYLSCYTRERNKGLFNADQNPRNSARHTRQNPVGARYGYECPEERDYYPHWHPSPWIDIAVLTNDVERCAYYQRESQNGKPRHACVFPKSVMEKLKAKSKILPNNKKDCEAYQLPSDIESDVRKPTWKEFPAHGVEAPECRETEFTRDNHLGNGIGGHPSMYNWTIPSYLESNSCALRIRYNISTSDFPGWETFSESNTERRNTRTGSKGLIAEKFELENENIARNRGYVLKNNPQVKIFDGIDLDLELAVNTAQFGRVFQDRSHVFSIKKLPDIMKDSTIHNLNVRGKRGNIVQVYPSVEYDFVPNDLQVSKEDYIHIQWTGSNTNPANNDGEGIAGTDRNNIVLLASQVFPEGRGSVVYPKPKFGHYGRNYPMTIDNSTFLGFSEADALSLAYLNPEYIGGLLNEERPYFDLPPRKITRSGVYHYMCTRNNNFSNRDQKGRISVIDAIFRTAAIGRMGGQLYLSDGSVKVTVPRGSFTSLQHLRLEKWSIEEGEEEMKAANSHISAGDDYASDFVVLEPENLVRSHEINKAVAEKEETSDDGVLVSMELFSDSDVEIYRATRNFGAWRKVNAEISGRNATFRTKYGGVFVARNSPSSESIAVIVGVVVACVLVLILIVAGVVYFRRHPGNWEKVKSNIKNVKRSTQSKV